MSAFEFFFSFYGLVLGLSVAVIATGLATAIQHRRKVQIGWLTPMLAAFVCLDIASFWSSAWEALQHLPMSYGLLIASLAVALTYFVACSLVFPHQIVDGDRLDDHFWANKRIVLALMIAANVLSFMVVVAANIADATKLGTITGLGVGLAFYLLLLVTAALSRGKRLFAVMIGTCSLLYAIDGVSSVVRANDGPLFGSTSASETVKATPSSSPAVVTK